MLETPAAAGVPVLPFRFGAVLPDAHAVEKGLLEPAGERFRRALDDLDGWAQFIVHGSYREERLLRGILAGHP